VLVADEDGGRILERLLARTDEPGADGLIVRSNSPSERGDHERGRFVSIRSAPTLEVLCNTIDQVLGQEASEGKDMFAIVQLYVRGEANGHMSNERRVSERPASWLVQEANDDDDSAMRYWRLHARTAERTLEAKDRLSLERTLRFVAGTLRSRTRRAHVEWVWSGERVWVVQFDQILAPKSPQVRKYLSASVNRPGQIPPGQLKTVRELADHEVEQWRKLRKPAIFDALGMPRAPIYFLSGETFTHLAGTASGRQELEADLASLTAGWPIVVRCDLAHDAAASDLSLPVSDPSRSPSALVEWMSSAAEELRARGIEPKSWAFLPARIVHARASVMALAQPDGQVVQLDALWGFPDGVSVLPHDTCIHQLTHDRVDYLPRYKGTCLLWNSGKGWSFETVPPPFDWSHVIDQAEVRTASSWARRLADHLQHEVQLMVLARIDGQRGGDAMLPWHFTDHRVPRLVGGRAPFAPARGALTVTGEADLDDEALRRSRSIIFRPGVAVRRERDFITAVAQAAAEANLPVYFEGSLLGHAYYILREAGAEVIPVGEGDPVASPSEYNKLVRDRIPEIIRRAGARPRVVRTSPENASVLLRHKIVEEAVEIWNSDSGDLVGELADLSEVLHALYERAGLTEEQVEATRQARRESRGGFDQLIYLESTTPETLADASYPAGVRPLFDASELRSNMRSSTPVDVIQPNARSMTFRIPLVPPLVEGLPLREHQIEVGNTLVTFRHTGREIEVVVDVQGAEIGPGQLSLAIE
jgi:predicted house-cleaning noncanonical NTP pyrophosphatase (MazG superfamily)